MFQGNLNSTPSQHRTQLGPQVPNIQQQNADRQNRGFTTGLSHIPTPSRRMPLGNMSANSVNRSNHGDYGMSAGAKIGRQQGMHTALIHFSYEAIIAQ